METAGQTASGKETWLESGIFEGTDEIPSRSGMKFRPDTGENIFRKMLKFGTGVPIFDSEVSKSMSSKRQFSTAARQDFQSVTGFSAVAGSRPRSYELELSMTDDVRAAAVARGKALITDPSYPSPVQVKKIARLLVASGLGR